MSTGTKVFFAVMGLLTAAIVLYYTTVPGDEAGRLKIEKPTSTPPAPGITQPRRDATKGRAVRQPEVRAAAPGSAPRSASERSGGPLTQSVAEATEQRTQRPVFGAVTPKRSADEQRSGTPSPRAGATARKDPVSSEPKPSPAVLTAPGRIPPGDKRRATPRPLSPVAPVRYTDYFVQPGDTMSLIAVDWFGDAERWDLIAKANPFVDPHKLKPGDLLRLPPRTTVREPIRPEASKRGGAAAGQSYTVRSGDTLSSIAEALLGSAAQWREVYQANRTTIGADPHRLEVGMKLVIPTAPKRPG